jgi:hypothetical protein
LRILVDKEAKLTFHFKVSSALVSATLVAQEVLFIVATLLFFLLFARVFRCGGGGESSDISFAIGTLVLRVALLHPSDEAGGMELAPTIEQDRLIVYCVAI